MNATVNRAKELALFVNALYFSVNVFIVLEAVEVWNEGDQIQVTNDSNKLLSSFLAYRTTKLTPNVPNDNAQFITVTYFPGEECGKGSVLGKAPLGTMCSDASGGISVDSSENALSVATTIAHEMGHNFNMAHDDHPKCKCILGLSHCIMAATHADTSYWSSCSLDDLTWAVEHSDVAKCLHNKPEKYPFATCGDAIIQGDEECDCGLVDFCTDPCCNATTCKLTPDASDCNRINIGLIVGILFFLLIVVPAVAIATTLLYRRHLAKAKAVNSRTSSLDRPSRRTFTPAPTYSSSPTLPQRIPATATAPTLTNLAVPSAPPLPQKKPVVQVTKPTSYFSRSLDVPTPNSRREDASGPLDARGIENLITVVKELDEFDGGHTKVELDGGMEENHAGLQSHDRAVSPSGGGPPQRPKRPPAGTVKDALEAVTTATVEPEVVVDSSKKAVTMRRT